MKVLYPITLDVKKTNIQKHIKAFTSEGGTRELIITLVSGNDTIELTNEYVVSVVGVKPDGTEFANTATVSDGKIHYTLTTQNVAVEGEVDCHIRVVKTNELLYTSKFAIDVEKNLSDEETETSSNEWTELINALNRVNNMSVIWSGEGAPSTDPEEYPDIQESNFYFDETNKVFYYAKSVGLTVTWEKIVNITELTAQLANYYTKTEVTNLIAKDAVIWHGTAEVNYRNAITSEYEGIKKGDIYIQEDEDQLFKQVCVVYQASAQMFILQPINNAYVSSSNPPSSTAANNYISLIDSTIWINSTTNRVYIKTASIGEPPSDTYVWQDLTGNRVWFGDDNPDNGTKLGALGKVSLSDYVGIQVGDSYIYNGTAGYNNSYHQYTCINKDSTYAYLKKTKNMFFLNEQLPSSTFELGTTAALSWKEWESVYEAGTFYVYNNNTYAIKDTSFTTSGSKTLVLYEWDEFNFCHYDDAYSWFEQLNTNKQDKLTAGSNVSISNNTISATDTTYTAGTNITIDSNNVISATGGIEVGDGLKRVGNVVSVDLLNDPFDKSFLAFENGKLRVDYNELGNNGVFRNRLIDTNYNNALASKTYVDNLISGRLKRLVVQTLPTDNIDTNTIYMILKSAPTTNNIYDEYMYINNAWELIGSTEVDLSNYYTKTESNQTFERQLATENGIAITRTSASSTIGLTISSYLNGNKYLKFSSNPYGLYLDFTAMYTDGLIVSKSTFDNGMSAKQDKLTAGTNITITDNVISASGGGGSYTAGNGIDISNDTIKVDLAGANDILGFSSGKLVLSRTNLYKDNVVRSGLTSTDYSNPLASKSYTDTELAKKQNVIDSTHKLSADNVDDTNTTNKFVSANEKQTWNAKADTSDIPTNVSELTNDSGYQTSSDVQTAISGKEDKTDITTDTTSTTVSLTLADNHEYRYTQDLTSLTLTMPNGDFIASVVFASGSTPTSMTYDSSIKWSGDDVTNGQFVPSADKDYDICLYYNGLNINGIVRGV